LVNCSRLKSQHNYGVAYMTINELQNLHFDNEQDIHMSSGSNEENGNGHDEDLSIISH
jgi:hypothetical protein